MPRTTSGSGAGRCRRLGTGPLVGLAGVLATGALVALPTAAYASSGTVLVNEAFTGTSVSSEWIKPTAPNGSNVACLTAGTSVATTPVPGCGLSTPDPSGSGALRLTAATGAKEGGVGYDESVPTTEGIDAQFDSYQYGSTSASPADGIAFYLAATDPNAPGVPTAIGQPGGSLGYSADAGSAGMADGYLGVGLDVYGNYENPGFEGSGCTNPGWDTGSKANSVSVRGPGNGTVGYCMLASTMQAGTTVTMHGSTRAGSQVPVEVVVNPTSSAMTTASGLSVPAGEFEVAYTPIGGTLSTLSGTLPSTVNGGIPSGLYPSSWINPSTGVPYQLTFGLVGSTGGDNDVHEINNLSVQSLAAVTQYTVAASDTTGGEVSHGGSSTLTVTPTVSASGAGESDPTHVQLTFPADTTPQTVSNSSWTCTLSGQVETCTSTTSSTPAGSSLPTLDVPFSTTANAGSDVTIGVDVYSDDATGATTTHSETVTLGTPSIDASASPGSTSYGTADKLSATVPSDATGTVTFTDGSGATLCTATVSGGTASCQSPSTEPAGPVEVTATYSGDSNYTSGATATTSYTVTPATVYGSGSNSGPVDHASSGTATAQVTGLAAGETGTITFTDAAGHTYCTATVTARVAGCQLHAGGSEFAVGSYPVTYSFTSSSPDYTSFSGQSAGTLVVTRTTLTVTAIASPTSGTYPTAFTLDLAGLPADATGTVTFTNAGGVTVCSYTLGSATSCTTPEEAAGSHTFTGSYSGDANYAPASAQVTTSVSQAVTSIAGSSQPASPIYGDPYTLTATGLPGDATGSVVFTDSAGTMLCTASVSSGAASCSPATSLPAGADQVTAAYGGDTNYYGSAATFTVNVGQDTPSIAVTGPTSPISYGTSATMRASLNSDATGTVGFYEGGTLLCTAQVIGGIATCSLPDLPAGSDTVTADYSGDNNYLPGSAQTTVTVTQAVPSMSASVLPSGSISYGSPATLVATLPSDATGAVNFTDNLGDTLCTATVVNGTASCLAPANLPAGSYQVTAFYPGDSNYLPASAQTGYQVTPATPTVTLANPGSATYGNPVALTATVPTDATGTVSFTDGSGGVLCTASVSGGTATCNTSASLPAGGYTVTANYSGDTNYTSASSAPGSLTIEQVANTAMSVTAVPNPQPYDQPGTFQVSLPPDATGVVTITVAGNVCVTDVGSSPCAVPNLPAGSYPVSASYGGDGNYAPATATTTLVVSQVATSMTGQSSTVTYGTAAPLGVTGLPTDATGTVTFTDSAGTTLCTATVVGGSASCTGPVLAVGDYPVTATYGGDGNYLGTTATLTITVTRASSTVTVSHAPGSPVYGTTVVLRMTGLAAHATGSVTFTDSSGATLCRATVVGGSASCTTAVLPAGSYAVTGSYSGDSNHQPVSATDSFTVAPAPTRLAAVVSPARGAVGSVRTLTATGLPANATGTVTFTDAAGSTMCVARVSSGSAWCATSSLRLGEHRLTATYGGDGNYLGSTAAVTAWVDRAATHLQAHATPRSVVVGTQVTLTAEGLPGAATGTVRFSDTTSGKVICTGTVRHGKASCTGVGSEVGTNQVTAAYGGDADHTASTAGTSFTVTRLATTGFGFTATGAATGRLTLTVTSALPPGAAGTVTFSSGGQVLCSERLPQRSCVSRVVLAAGEHLVTASYSGDRTHAPATAVTVVTVPGASAVVPAVHTGEPWSGWPYWALVAALAAAGVTALTRRRPWWDA